MDLHLLEEYFKDTKGLIRSRNSKDMQYNGQPIEQKYSTET